jgi:chromate reductase
MPDSYTVAVVVGSLRKESLTRKVANAAIENAPPRLKCILVDIGELSVYNEDLDEKAPATWTKFRQEIAASHAVLFLTPEYNRSIPGGLKNAIDVGSRPSGKSVWSAKPAAVISVTPYKLGAMAANHAVRQALVFLNVPVMQQPEAYISEAAGLFDDAGKLKNDDTRAFLKKFMEAFEQWVAKLAAAK